MKHDEFWAQWLYILVTTKTVYRILSVVIIYFPSLIDKNREWNHSFADIKPCCPYGRPNAIAVARFK